MTTWYVDYQGGADTNAASLSDGSTFATRKKTISRIVSTYLAPGDEIRVMGSPAPTSVGNATWTGDYGQRGGVSPTSSTNTSPIQMVLNSVAYANIGLSVGDTVIVQSHTVNTNANGVWKVGAKDDIALSITLLNADGSNSVGNGVGGSSGTIRKATNMVVNLATACTQNIACCGNRGTLTNWTASTNVTTSINTADYKEGGECQQIVVAAGFTTGLAAYVPTGTLDLSGYQQLSFWVKITAGNVVPAGGLSLSLCSDSAGTVVVNTVSLPLLGTLQWSPVVVDLGTNLGSNIQSIALYVNTDNGANTVLLDNIIACKASGADDSLNLTSLISKNTGDEAWFGIQSINGTRVMLDGTVNTIPASSPQRGYIGTTETVTTYKRETIKTTMAASGTTQVQAVQDSGTSGNLITISGGWNRTDMSTQDGVTWFDGQNGYGSGLYANGKSFLSIDKLNFARYNVGLNFVGTTTVDNSVSAMYFCNCTNAPLADSGYRNTYTKLGAVCCGGTLTLGSGSIVDTIARADSAVGSANGVAIGNGARVSTVVQASNNGASGVASGINSYIGKIQAANNNAQHGYIIAGGSYCGSLTAEYNGTAAVNPNGTDGGIIAGGSTTGNGSGNYGIYISTGLVICRGVTMGETFEVATPTAYTDGKIISENHDNTAGYHVHFCDGGRIETQTSVKYGDASYAWKMSPTSTNRNVNYPLPLALGKRYITGSTTFKVWMQRNDTGLTMRLVCKGGQISGVDSDVVGSMTAAADTWEQVSITVSPSAAGVIELEAQAYGGTAYSGYVSVMEII